MKRISAILLALVLCISVLSICAFAAYDTVQSLAVVGSGIPGVNEWDPADPAGDMTKVSDGIYEKVLALPAGTTITFKIAGNDKWDDTCNFGTGAALELDTVTELPINTTGGDMTFTAAAAMNIKITVDITQDVATILVAPTDDAAETPDTPETPDVPETPDTPDTPSEGMVKVHAYVPEGITPSFWAWQSSTQKNAFEAWPGNAMTKDGDWWVIEVPNWCDGMIVNSGSDENKTQDISVEAGKEVWIVVNPYNWFESTAHYEEVDPSTIIPSEPPKEDENKTSRPTLGETTPTTSASDGEKVEEEIDYGARKNKALIIIGTAVLAIIAVSFVLSIPKKIQ